MKFKYWEAEHLASGSVEFAKPVFPVLSTIKHAFAERSRKAKALFYDKSVFVAKDRFTEIGDS